MRDLEQFQRELPQHHLAPLWEVLRTLTPREPASPAVPALWKAAMLREQLHAAGRLITAAQAERRVLVLENPGLPAQSRATTSLYAGVQLILPGERARSHRHSAAALRLVLEGEGAYTTVAGQRIPMHAGDFIVTPSWSYHEHGNDGREPVIWLDGLDVPIVNALCAGFSEEDTREASAREHPAATAGTTLFSFSYRAAREQLEQRRHRAGAGQAVRVPYRDPATGRSAFATMEAALTLVAADRPLRSARCTDATVWAVLEGSGTVSVGAERWSVDPHDLFVVPSWTWHHIEARAELVLFGFSDRPLQQALGLWREERR
ncbi:MAG TPA: cupin domain-containing protein [Steroidobacteraceae bacterium]|nr:cupin domain-containing protein [Steroidobacteraceae bacterium]